MNQDLSLDFFANMLYNFPEKTMGKPFEQYEKTVEFCGEDQTVVVSYLPTDGFPGSREQPEEKSGIEITSVALKIQGDLIQIPTSGNWDKELIEEIIEWREDQ